MPHNQNDICSVDENKKKEETKLPSRHLADSIIISDIESQLREIKLEEAWDRNGHNARTLVKHPDFRIVLIAMKKGTHIPKHKANGEISIQVLKGHIRLHIARRAVDLSIGHLVALDQALPHDVEAIEESAFLLSISGSKEV